MKKLTPQKQIKQYANEIVKEKAMWKSQHKNGCNDPCWADGVNLNLLRNHVTYYKSEILRLCVQAEQDPPQEYYYPTPPYIDNNYFAKPKSERAKRIMSRPGWKCTNQGEPPKNYNEAQTSLF